MSSPINRQLDFTTSNWHAWQTVTVSAAEDADAANGTAELFHRPASTDQAYNGNSNGVTVTATEADNDRTVSPGDPTCVITDLSWYPPPKCGPLGVLDGVKVGLSAPAPAADCPVSLPLCSHRHSRTGQQLGRRRFLSDFPPTGGKGADAYGGAQTRRRHVRPSGRRTVRHNHARTRNRLPQRPSPRAATAPGMPTRVLAVVAEGLSHRAAAARFGVSAASVSRWRRRAAEQGDPRPRALGGHRCSGRIEAHSDVILGVLAETPDITIEELRHLLAGRGLDFGYGTIQRFLVRYKMTRKKKTGHPSEQDRADVVERRQAWRDSQAALEPASLVFIDETWAKANMARTRGRAPRGRRLHMGQPYSHWKTSTLVAGLTLRGMIAPFVLDGPINRLAFETYVEKVLVPELRTGDIVIMDSLSSHKGARVRERVEAVGAELLFLPSYSPELNPIEMAFSKLKALLRKATERTVDGLCKAIATILETFKPQEFRDYFAAAGYDPG